jgi:hypothetical protein
VLLTHDVGEVGAALAALAAPGLAYVAAPVVLLLQHLAQQEVQVVARVWLEERAILASVVARVAVGGCRAGAGGASGHGLARHKARYLLGHTSHVVVMQP